MNDEQAAKPKAAGSFGRTLLIVLALLLLLLVPFLPWLIRGLNQRAAEAAVKAAGGRASYGKRLHADATYVTDEKRRGKKGMVADVFGEAFVEQLTQVEIKKPLERPYVLGRLSKLRELEILDLSGAGVSDDDFKLIARCETLKKLWVGQDGGKVTAAGIAELSGLPNLASLGLDNLALSDEAMDSIAGHTTLKRLYMDGTQVTDDGVSKLTGLQGLMGIGLQGTSITDAAIDALLAMKELEEVRIGNTGVTNAGVSKLASLPKLKSLNLENNKLTDDGLAWLADAKTLEIVDLSGTQVTDAIADTLASMPKLITVYLHRTAVTKPAWEALRRELGSGVQVQHSEHSELATQ